MLHRDLSLGENHRIHNWEVADATELAALVLAAEDEGKIARQLDTGAFLLLSDWETPVWTNMAGSPPPPPPVPGEDNFGYLNIPQVSKSEDYTLVLEDSGKHIYHPAADANARTFTIPANSSVAFPIGTAITFINDSEEDVTIAITSDTLVLAGDGTTGSRTLAQYGMATAVKTESTKWYISGSGVS